MDDDELEAYRQAWAAVTDGDRPPPLEVTGARGRLFARSAVEAAATATVATALAVAAPGSTVRLDRGHVAAAVRSERYFTLDGAPGGGGFAPLSRFWPTADGWLRTHANYPWHRNALLAALGIRDEAEPVARVTDVLSERSAADVEEAVYAAGGIAVRVRDQDEWRAGPAGRAVAAEPLVARREIGSAAARGERAGTSLRVLDLTRVIAGPVCTRLLGALGADVLRLDPPDRPDGTPGQASDTLLAKRTAVLDARNAAGRTRLDELLAAADVLVCGYRPGSLDRFGLTDEDLAERCPGLVVVRLAAWGHSGPWAQRRGFDSVVQAATGIATHEATDGTPGALPCQLLDHGTGYLAAAAALEAVGRQRADGGTQLRTLSLARTADWLSALPAGGSGSTAPADTDWTAELHLGGTAVRAVRPPGEVDGRPLRWPDRVSGYLQDEPVW